MLYRILTENKNEYAIIVLVLQYFDNFTVYRGAGVFHGVAEPALVIEIDTGNDNIFDRVRLIAQEIKKLNDQECVLVQKIQCESEFV